MHERTITNKQTNSIIRICSSDYICPERNRAALEASRVVARCVVSGLLFCACFRLLARENQPFTFKGDRALDKKRGERALSARTPAPSHCRSHRTGAQLIHSFVLCLFFGHSRFRFESSAPNKISCGGDFHGTPCIWNPSSEAMKKHIWTILKSCCIAYALIEKKKKKILTAFHLWPVGFLSRTLHHPLCPSRQ